MLKKLWVLSMLMLLPAFSTAAGPQAPLKFFDAIPGQQDSNTQSRSSVSSREVDIFWETWTSELLSEEDIERLRLPSDPEARSKMIESLIQFRAANRAARSSGLSKQDLRDDLFWAANHGFHISNPKSLIALEQKFREMTDEEQIQYAQKMSGELGQIQLEGVLNGMRNADLALRFLIQNPNVVSPERRDTLIFKNLVKLTEYGLEDPSRSNTNMALVRKAASLLNYNSTHTICRAAANAAMVDYPSNREVQREYNEVMVRGLVEMTKKDVDCRDYISTEGLLFKLASLEEANLYGRGFFIRMIKKLERADDTKSGSSPQIPVPNSALNQCLVDKRYSNEVEVEFNKMNTAPVGSSNLFGANSKGDCKLRVIVQKLKAGFKAYIVVENPIGATLIRFDQKFKTIQEMKNAAIFGTPPL